MKTLNKHQGQKGAALLMALFFFTIATFVIMQLSQETLTEATIAGQSVKKVRSHYSAKAGLELALLRIKAFHEARHALSKLGNNVPPGAEQQLDMIWQFPLPWPLPLPDGAGKIATDEGEKLLGKSLLSNVQFIHEIKDAGEKVDVNSLGSPIKRISEKSIESLLRSFERILETDKVLSREHSLETIKVVLHNLADWTDEDTQSRNGGDEQSLYPYEDQTGYPRNQSFMTLSELMLVDKMDDLIFNHLKHLITINGTFGINVNTASKNTIMGIDEEFTEDMAANFIEQREAYKETSKKDLDKDSFDNILSEIGFSDISGIHTKGVPILFSPLSAFYIESSGVSGEVETIIKAHVIDAASLKEIFIDQLDKSVQTQNPPPNDPKAPAPAKPPPAKGRPFVVHMEIN